MVSDCRMLPRERCSLELRVHSRSAGCGFREDLQRISKELLESSWYDNAADTPPDPSTSIPIHLLVSDDLCGWPPRGGGPCCEIRRHSFRRKKYNYKTSHENSSSSYQNYAFTQNCPSYQYGENTSNYSDGDFAGVENHASRKKRKTHPNESVENFQRFLKQDLPIPGFSWKACVDERTGRYRPDNREYLQWKDSAHARTQPAGDRIEKHCGKTSSKESVSAGSTPSKPETESQLHPEHLVAEKEEEEAGKVDALPTVDNFDYGSEKVAQLRLVGEIRGSGLIRNDDRVRNGGRCLVIGQLRAGLLRRNGLPEDRPSLPPILPQPRISHGSLSSQQRRVELQTLSVAGFQVSGATRNSTGRGDEDGWKQMRDGFPEEGNEEEEEEEEEGADVEEPEENLDSEIDVFESNDSETHDSGVNMEANVMDGRTQDEDGDGYRNSMEMEAAPMQLDGESNKISSTETQEEDDTSSSLSRTGDEGRQSIRQTIPDNPRFRNNDADPDDNRKGESLTGVLKISGFCPPIGAHSYCNSENTSGSEFKNAPRLDVNGSDWTTEDPYGATKGPEKARQGNTLCLNFRRNPADDHPTLHPGKRLRLRDVRDAKQHRSRSPPDPSRNRVEIAGATVVGVTFSGQADHVTLTHSDVTAKITSPCRPEKGVDTSSTSALRKCDVVSYLSQSNCRGLRNGFHPQPIGAHQRTRRTMTGSRRENPVSTDADRESRLPLITGTRVEH